MSIVVVQEKERMGTIKAAKEALRGQSSILLTKNMKDSVSEAEEITITIGITF